jgi:ABC-2 type transport system permease protein
MMMHKFLTIMRRELASLFLSPVAYVTAVVFVAASGWTFLQAVETKVGSDDSVALILVVSVLLWVPILVTVICMRLFAEEKRSGTIESLMTAPVTETVVILGKYVSSLLFAWVVIAPAISGVYVLSYISPGIESVDHGAVAGGCLILGLITACCIAIGLLVSLLTRNQIVAAICCFAAICIPFFIKSLAATVPFLSDAMVEYVSLESHVIGFSSGGISLQVVVFYLSVTVLMLFASIRILESRRWL